MTKSVAVRAFSWRHRNSYDINGPGLQALAKAGFQNFDKILIQFSEVGESTIMRFVLDAQKQSPLKLTINGNRGRVEGLNRAEWAFDGPHSFEVMAIGKGIVHFRSIGTVKTVEVIEVPRKKPAVTTQRLELKFNPFVDALNRLIVANDISITQLAANAKLSSSHMSLITRAKRTPKKGTLNKILRQLRVSDKERAQLYQLRDYAELLGGKDVTTT